MASSTISQEEQKVKEEERELELERDLLSFSSKYSLSSGRSPSSSGSSGHKSPWQGQVDMIDDELPSISPSDYIKTLFSQLVSSISSMKGAFAHLRAMLRAYSGSGGSSVTVSPAEKIMVEELQRLSSLHTRLYRVLQEQGAMKKERNVSADITKCMEEQSESLLKSYEGIISRFHDEIRKKDAVVEALKETLAKSMLKGEKLERRVKSLEAKLSLKELVS